VWVSLIEDLVPKSVELFNAVVTLEWEIVSTLVSSWEFFAEEGLTVERLVNISIVVDQKAECV